ncbi:hypothetical protein K3495_g5316 [Podosphaera aphanis]|nr:hypothetical protein K3495_g5316 [Podosphaera aphanis]
MRPGNSSVGLEGWKGRYQELLEKIAEPLGGDEIKKVMIGCDTSQKWFRLLFGGEKGERKGSKLDENESMAAMIGAGIDENRAFGVSKILDGSMAMSTTIPRERFLNSGWYEDIACFLAYKEFPKECVTKVQRAALIRKSLSYSVENDGTMYHEMQDLKRRCVVQEEVALILREAHDEGGHFSQAITQRKLKLYYWPKMVVDIRDYIKGCLTCARFGTAVRSQFSARVTVNEPMELLGIDFIGPFPKFEGITKTWRLVTVTACKPVLFLQTTMFIAAN